MKKRFCLKTVALATVLILTGCVGSENTDSSEISVTTTPCILLETELVMETKPPQSVTSLDNDTTDISVTEKNKTVDDILYEKVSSLKCFSSIEFFSGGVDVSQEGMNSDEIIKLLADKNIVCYYTFNSDVMFHDYQKYDDNGYGEIRHYLFSSYSELEKFVYATYEKSYAESLLSDLYGSPETLFKGDDSVLLYNPSVQGINVLVGEVFSPYKCEITDITDTRIDFNIRFLENDKLMFSSVAVLEDGEWRLREMFPNLSEEADIEQSKVTSEVTHPIEPVVEYVFSLDNDSIDNESIEDNARYLVYRNLICSYTYCTQSLFDYVNGETIDGYAPIEFELFNDYEEFSDFIRDTYTAESSEVILNNFRGKGAVFIQKGNATLYDQNRTGFTTGPFFGEKFVIEITDFSNNECNFTCSPNFSEFTDDVYKTTKENYSESEYIHNFKMIFEDGKWKLDKMVLAF